MSETYQTYIKMLNGDLISITDPIDSIDSHHVVDIVSKHLNVSRWCVNVVFDIESNCFNAIVFSKPVVQLPSFRYTRLNYYKFLETCVNESLLTHFLDILADPTIVDDVDDDGQTLESMIWRFIVKNPHPLVVEMILSTVGRGCRHPMGLSANPSDSVMDHVFANPEIIHAPNMLTNPNPRAIAWVMANFTNDGRFTSGQWYPFFRNIATTPECVEWALQRFEDMTNKYAVLFNTSDASVDAFLQRFPSPQQATHVFVNPPLSTRSDLVPYHLYRMEMFHTFSSAYHEFLATHPDDRITDWLIQHVEYVEDSREILEEMYGNPNEKVLDWLMSSDNPKLRKWLLGVNPNPRAHDIFKTLITSHQTFTTRDVSQLKAVLAYSTSVEIILTVMDVLVSNGCPQSEWISSALEGLSHSNEWIFSAN